MGYSYSPATATPFKKGLKSRILNIMMSQDNNFHPLLKWPGGKSTEFEYIKHLIPEHTRYVEPFFGGGAVFFKLAPSKAIINDIADELVDLYRFVKGDLNTDELRAELNTYADVWDAIDDYIVPLEEQVTKAYRKLYDGEIDSAELKALIQTMVDDEAQAFKSLFSEDFCVDSDNLAGQIVKNLSQKLIRTVKVERNTPGGFSKEDLFKNIETGFKSGFYMHFRDLLNRSKTYKISRAKHIANWYYVREYCYASMFRFNSKGEFNIPYGGIGYNKKSLRGKIDYMFSPDVQELFKTTDIFKKDFAELVDEIKLTENDFVFLDPPYDTEFSSYEGNTFDQDDQKRLADFVANTSAKCMMVIKETPYIKSLYSDDKFTVESFEKSYLYNVRGRNNRDVNHLIIRNYSA